MGPTPFGLRGGAVPCPRCGGPHLPGPGVCTPCRAAFTPEERREYIATGIQRMVRVKDAGAPTREELFEDERRRLAAKRMKKPKR